MNWRSETVLVLAGALILTACGSASERGSGRDSGQDGQQSRTPQRQPSSESSADQGPTTGSGSPGSTGEKKRVKGPRCGEKPQVDHAKASPGGFTVRYLGNGKVEQLDVPDFER